MAIRFSTCLLDTANIIDQEKTMDCDETIEKLCKWLDSSVLERKWREIITLII